MKYGPVIFDPYSSGALDLMGKTVLASDNYCEISEGRGVAGKLVIACSEGFAVGNTYTKPYTRYLTFIRACEEDTE